MSDDVIWRHTDEDGDQVRLITHSDHGYALFIPVNHRDQPARRVYLDRDALDDLAAIIHTEPRS